VTFPETATALACPTEVTGNPVRREVSQVPDREAGPARRVLVFGGSRGAHQINRVAIEAAPALAETGLHVVHQTGEADYEDVARAYREAGVRGEVHRFLHDMPARYAAADIVVARAGATTVAELAAAGRPAIFIPFPHATHDHQRANARRMAEAGAAEVIDPDDLAPGSFVDVLRRLASDGERLDRMARAARAQARPDAAERIADLAARLLEGRR
jgi:UDP-N-acetylglucosamine--N-acetylmuramyl-(pentapeptide) pyrophosphoryl-undecaprenol N-acetylglucosamine transferase